jgi:hypothetical protein
VPVTLKLSGASLAQRPQLEAPSSQAASTSGIGPRLQSLTRGILLKLVVSSSATDRDSKAAKAKDAATRNASTRNHKAGLGLAGDQVLAKVRAFSAVAQRPLMVSRLLNAQRLRSREIAHRPQFYR